MGLLWGVTALHLKDAADTARAVQVGAEWARAQGLLAPGARATLVFVQGTIPGSAVHDGLLVREIG